MYVCMDGWIDDLIDFMSYEYRGGGLVAWSVGLDKSPDTSSCSISNEYACMHSEIRIAHIYEEKDSRGATVLPISLATGSFSL